MIRAMIHTLPAAFLLAALLAPVTAWSRPPDMIQVEVEVFEVIHSAGQKLGFSWNFVKREGSSGDLLNSFSRFPIGIGDSGQLSVEVLDLHYGVLTADIEASMRRGNARLLSRPTLVTLNNKKASIASGEELPFIELTMVNKKGEYGTKFRQTGVNLEVTPKIIRVKGREDRVRMTVMTSVQEVNRIESVEQNGKTWELPVISSRKANAPLLVNDQNTVVMGGLLEQRHMTRESGVPYLSGVPLLGALFRSKKQETVESEVIIFITPTILRPGIRTDNKRKDRITRSLSKEGEVAPSGTGKPRSAIASSETKTSNSSLVDGLHIVEMNHTFRADRDNERGDKQQLMVTGKVENRNDVTVKNAELEVTLYDLFGAIMDTKTIKVKRLKSGQQRTFKIDFKNFDDQFVDAFNVQRIEILPYLN
jgi:Flp pilus assembly secretin CpaC